MTSKKTVTQDRLFELFAYDKETGAFYRRLSNRRWKAGQKAGYKAKNGYVQLSIDGCLFFAHRLAWLYVYGDWPKFCIDHIDGDPSNNKISNLRDVRHRTNIENEIAPRKNNSTGFLGVKFDKRRQKFVATITVNYAEHYIGSAATAKEASDMYLHAKRLLHAGCTI